MFLVFVNDDRIIYDWRWEKTDPDEMRLPVAFAQRFEVEITMTNEELAQLVLSQVSADFHFQPTAYYDADGDFIEFIFRNDNYYAEQVDSVVTVYRSRDSNELVGSQIHRVSQFLRGVLEREPGFRIEIHDGRIKLTHLFTAKLWSEAGDPAAVPTLVYQRLRQAAEESGTEVEVGALALR